MDACCSLPVPPAIASLYGAGHAGRAAKRCMYDQSAGYCKPSGSGINHLTSPRAHNTTCTPPPTSSACLGAGIDRDKESVGQAHAKYQYLCQVHVREEERQVEQVRSHRDVARAEGRPCASRTATARAAVGEAVHGGSKLRAARTSRSGAAGAGLQRSAGPASSEEQRPPHGAWCMLNTSALCASAAWHPCPCCMLTRRCFRTALRTLQVVLAGEEGVERAQHDGHLGWPAGARHDGPTSWSTRACIAPLTHACCAPLPVGQPWSIALNLKAEASVAQGQHPPPSPMTKCPWHRVLRRLADVLSCLTTCVHGSPLRTIEERFAQRRVGKKRPLRGSCELLLAQLAVRVG